MGNNSFSQLLNMSRNNSFLEEESAECKSYNSIMIAVLIYSIVVLILYTLLQRRASKHKEFLHGFLGIPIPVNLIHETKDRWIYAISFGVLTGQFLYIILDGGSVVASADSVGNIWKGIVLILIMMIYPLLFFALFASIHGPVQIFSQIIGFVYISLVFIQTVLRCSSCDDALDDDLPAGILRNTQRATLYSNCIINGSCCVIIGAFFVYKGLQATVYLAIDKPLPPQHSVQHYIGHVKRLLSRPPPSIPSNRILAVIQANLYQWDPYFKYSVRILSTAAVVVIALILLTFQLVNFMILLANVLEVLYGQLDIEQGLIDALVGLSYFFGVLIPFASCVIVLIGFILSLAAYRRQCKLLWKGDRSFLPAKQKPFARTLLSSIYFFGFQVAMVIWAWIVYVIVLILALLVLAVFIVVMILFEPVRKWVLRQFVFFITSFLTGLAIYYAQYFFIKYVFVSKDGSLINNRRLFHIFTFFFLFYYMLVGLFKAIRRLITSAALNLFYLSRLDVPQTIKGWEWLDKAYVSYTALLKVDASHNNPVMNAFIFLVSRVAQVKVQRALKTEPDPSMLTSTINKITATQYYDSSLVVPLVNIITSAQENSDISTSRAKIRWHLAYTLINNPDLIILRRRGDQNEDNKENMLGVNPAYVDDDGGEFGVPSEKNDATIL